MGLTSHVCFLYNNVANRTQQQNTASSGAIASLRKMAHRVQCSSSSSEMGEHCNENAQLCINCTPSEADERAHTAFMPLAPVVCTDGTTYESFAAYVASMPPKNCHVVPDERFQRFVRILNGEGITDGSLAQLKRDREKLFNTLLKLANQYEI